MCKTDLFLQIIRLVEAESEIEASAILNPRIKTAEVVDARHLLVYFLRRRAGYNAGYIALRLNMTAEAVNKVVRNFDDRLQHGGAFFKLLFKQIDNSIKSN